MILIAALFLQVSFETNHAARQAMLEAGVDEIKGIDSELAEIKKNQAELRKSLPIRQEEISSLRTRFPEIKIPDGAAVETIYSALTAVRTDRTKKYLAMAQEHTRAAQENLCEIGRDVQKDRREFEATDDYKQLTLAERLEWRKEFDAMVQDCPAPSP